VPEATVARRILEATRALVLESVFGLPGVHNLAFWRDCGDGASDILGVRHEQTTVYAADGHARATGGLGVALTTTGPGAAHAAGAFGEAAASGSPVLLIASEISTRLARPGVQRGVLHESRDQAAIFEPLAKAVYRPRTAEDAVRDVGAAIMTALEFPRGPVYVDIPTDVLDQPAGPVTVDAPEPPAAERAALDALVEAIADAERIVLWVGGGAVQADAGEEVRLLAERLGAPVVTTYSARGILPSSHPCSVGMPPHEPEVAALIGGADLLLAVGSDFDGMMTRNWTMPTAARLAAINCDPVDLGKNYEPDVAVLADARSALRELLALVPEGREGQHAHAHAVRRAVTERLATDGRNAEPLEFLASVEGAIGADTVVVADMAIPGYWVGGYGQFGAPRRLQYPVGWGTLGYALPASVGAAARGRPVLAISGDGGFMFAVGELATIVQQRLPITVLIVDDGGYGMLRFDQEHAGDEQRGVELMRPDFLRLADSFGIHATVVEGAGQPLRAALSEAIASGEPRMVITALGMIPPRTTSPRWAE
jgi:acetolactate synthase-1/2/3 large subunit